MTTERAEAQTKRVEPFCIGVKGRDQCDTCAGRYVPAPGWSVPPRILIHQPWPFEPCPHYSPEQS
jgi:hypothetical protein